MTPPSASTLPQFHLALPCLDLDETIAFYGALGCAIGRRNASAVTINFFGHQVVAHRVEHLVEQRGIYPRHFGVILDSDLLQLIKGRLQALTPESTSARIRFEGSAIEHETLLARDPSANQIEFKCYSDSRAALAPLPDDRIGDTSA